jgi:uncharacterized protein
MSESQPIAAAPATQPEQLAELGDRLIAVIRAYGSCAVAFSGGVDSAVAAKAAHLALGDRAVAVTGSSASLAEGELEQAAEVARLIGIRHEVVATHEVSDPNYLRNAPDRCLHCKTELYAEVSVVAARLGLAVLVNGANRDDLGDYRPGMIAAQNFQVRSPLVECGLDKQAVRGLALDWQLPVWDKPASPCLSSRIAYGESVTPERLQMIDRAEQCLRHYGLDAVRVRYHRGDLARIEVPVEALSLFCQPEVREAVLQRFREVGFKFVTLDLAGFRSGSLNTLLPVEVLAAWPGRSTAEPNAK